MSCPTKRGSVLNGSYSKLRIVMTVNATAMFNVLPVPMYTLKITADNI